MNVSAGNNTTGSFSNDYLTGSLLALVVISELLPFLKKNDKFNGILHTLVCLLKGSKCVIDKTLDVVEPVDNNNMENVA